MGTEVWTIDALIELLKHERDQMADDEKPYILIGTHAEETLTFEILDNGLFQMGTHIYAGLTEGENGLMGMKVNTDLQGCLIADPEQVAEDAKAAAITVDRVRDEIIQDADREDEQAGNGEYEDYGGDHT
ncbi:hypothetical protein HTZ84_21035 [Haloterrigena sp. SYSU A558-1]|uniref:Uncharacterized protein n=1 Tax=Haloterrigena gelatinilytica TaxID=2741724 RepID=A0ABX2LH27_9EURY|nr:hypothetical protein [Haloterrigena gelatinilytica]NUC74750.1 hypothetical protein [Haloterrigena gelatinilytica]